jgi:hypothetical protein
MFVAPAQAGGERKRRAFALSFPRLRNGKKLLWPLPCADRGNRRPSSAAADEHAPSCSHSRADNGVGFVSSLSQSRIDDRAF